MGLAEAVAYALDILSPTAVAHPPPMLRIFAFGPVRIYRGERLLTTDDWVYSKARELVLYLLCRPTATREQIGLAFWPDASTEQVRKRFSAALTHARNALGRETSPITLTDEHYRLQPACWFDVEVFEARLREIRRLNQLARLDERALPLLEEAISLYQGDFADDVVDSEWPVARRTALRQGYLECLLMLGRIRLEAGCIAQAMEAYRQALDKDPYLEEAHTALMRCYALLNQRSQALQQYQLLAQALTELDATPSPESQTLLDRLRRGETASA